MKIHMSTVTPVFTGDRNMNQSSTLRHTGIIGSLRFWAGAISRGLGIDVQQNATPEFDTENEAIFQQQISRLDPVTRTFGCTNWGRTFRLNIDEKTCHDFGDKSLHVETSKHGWHLKPGFLIDAEKKISVIPVFRQGIETWTGSSKSLVGLTWNMIGGLTGLGAHQGWGYGRVTVLNPDDGQPFKIECIDSLVKKLIETNGDKAPSNDHQFPQLTDFVFAEYEFNKKNVKLKPLVGNHRLYDHKRWKWPHWQSFPAVFDDNQQPIKPVGLMLRYLLQFNSAIKDWRKIGFYGGSGKKDHAGHFQGTWLYRVNEKGEPDKKGEKTRFRIWAWLPGNKFKAMQRQVDGTTIPSWLDAANILRNELQAQALWNAATGGVKPRECYFWPLTPSRATTSLQFLSPLLQKIEDRAIQIPGRENLREIWGGEI